MARSRPRQITTGGKTRLAGIPKRGNGYLRKLLIHGAKAVLPTLLQERDSARRMVARASGEVHKNAAVVALANKLARIVWAVLRRKETFNPSATALA